MTVHDINSAFRRDGVVFLPSLFDPKTVETVQAEIEDLIATYAVSGPIRVHAFVGRDDKGVFVQYPSRDLPRFRDFWLSSPAPRVAATLLGSKSISLWSDELHYKFAEDSSYETAWHHDISVFPFAGAQIVSIWVALTAMEAGDSPVCFAKGSHLRGEGHYFPPNFARPDPPPAGYVPVPDFESEALSGSTEIVQWPLAPGDAIAFSPLTAHAATRNSGVRKRVAYVSRWIGDDVRWKSREFTRKDPPAEESLAQRGSLDGPLFPRVDFGSPQ